MGGFGGEAGPGGQLGVGLIVAGQEGDGDGALAGCRGQLLEAIGPIAAPAQQPHHHHLGMADHLIHIKVHRHGMAQMQKAGEAEA